MTRPDVFVWTPLKLPTPLSVETVRAGLAALAGLAGQPRLVLEVTGRDGRVGWKLGCPGRVRARVLDALSTQIPGLRAERSGPPADGPRADLAISLRLPGGREPLNHAASESVIRGLLGALSRAGKGELVHLQVVLGPRSRPTHLSATTGSRRTSDQAVRRAVTSKLSEHRFACEIRVAASTPRSQRSQALIRGVIGALRPLEAPGVRLHPVAGSAKAFSRAASPLLWRTTLGISELVAFTGWPIADDRAPALPGLPPRHPRLLPAVAAVPASERPLGVSVVDPTRSVALGVTDSLRHLHVLGPTGVGKSTLLARLALADIAAGRAVVVIDPKGDLVDDILARADERRRGDLVVLDPRDPNPVGINGLAGSGGHDPHLAADILLGVFHSLYADAWGPRTHDVLHASLLTLAIRGDASLAMIPMLLTNPGFRRSVIGRVVTADPQGLGSFWSSFDAISEAERQQVIAPLMRRLRPILLRPGLKGILAQRRPKFDLTDVFIRRRILLVSLAKGVIGPEAAELLGSLVVSQFWMATLGRAAIDAVQRHPVMVYIDEVQDYLRLPGDLGDALAQARGLGVGLTLAHQHLDQLPPGLRAAVTANARSRIAFQLNGKDARDMAGLTRGQLESEDFESLPVFTAYAQVLAHGTPTPWLSLSTQPLPPGVRDVASVRADSAARYGQPLDAIEADLVALTTPAPGGSEGLGRQAKSARPDDSAEAPRHHDQKEKGGTP